MPDTGSDHADARRPGDRGSSGPGASAGMADAQWHRRDPRPSCSQLNCSCCYFRERFPKENSTRVRTKSRQKSYTARYIAAVKRVQLIKAQSRIIYFPLCKIWKRFSHFLMADAFSHIFFKEKILIIAAISEIQSTAGASFQSGVNTR